MNEKKFQISAREVAKRMDSVVADIVSGETETGINMGTLVISEFKAVMSMYRLQLEVAKSAGKTVIPSLIDMS